MVGESKSSVMGASGCQDHKAELKAPPRYHPSSKTVRATFTSRLLQSIVSVTVVRARSSIYQVRVRLFARTLYHSR